MTAPADSGGPFWPWTRRKAILAGPFILVILLTLLALARAIIGWPSEAAEGAVLAGLIVLALLPVILMLLGHLAGSGGSVEAFGVHIRFAAEEKVRRGMVVPPRLGLQPGLTLNDSSTFQILDILGEAVHNDVVVVDLEDGTSWWETRLFVLSAGAARLGRPRAIAFVATTGGTLQVFKGWAPAGELFRCLLEKRHDLRAAYDRAFAIYRTWELAIPALLPDAANQPKLPFPHSPETGAHAVESAVFPDGTTKSLLAPEQILALHLSPIENDTTHGVITATRLIELFDTVLRVQSIDLDQSENDAKWVQTVLSTTDSFLALTRSGQYAGMLPREAAINDIMRALVATHPPHQ